jgi:hypothetical protein
MSIRSIDRLLAQLAGQTSLVVGWDGIEQLVKHQPALLLPQHFADKRACDRLRNVMPEQHTTSVDDTNGEERKKPDGVGID